MEAEAFSFCAWQLVEVVEENCGAEYAKIEYILAQFYNFVL